MDAIHFNEVLAASNIEIYRYYPFLFLFQIPAETGYLFFSQANARAWSHGSLAE
tara:strand:+ start:427 stop:588 length:162 start_codon:yes stop_codon:yes gene_type:complete